MQAWTGSAAKQLTAAGVLVAFFLVPPPCRAAPAVSASFAAEGARFRLPFLSNPAALGFLPAGSTTLVSGRLVAPRVTATPSDSFIAQWNATMDPAGSAAPLAAAVAFGFDPPVRRGPRAGLALVYRRTANGFDGHTASVLSRADPDSAPSRESMVGTGVTDSWTLGLGVGLSDWIALGVGVGAQVTRNHARVTTTRDEAHPADSPDGATGRVTATRSINLESRLTPVLLYGAQIRAGRVVDASISYRPDVTLLFGTAAFDTSGESRVFYPGQSVFRLESWDGGVALASASSRTDAELATLLTVHVVRPLTVTASWQRVGSVEAAFTTPSRKGPAGLGTVPMRWWTLWGGEASWSLRPGGATVRVGARQALRGAWSFDGQPAPATRGGGPSAGVTLPAGPFSVGLDVESLVFRDTAALPTMPQSSRVPRETREWRLDLTLEMIRPR